MSNTALKSRNVLNYFVGFVVSLLIIFFVQPANAIGFPPLGLRGLVNDQEAMNWAKQNLVQPKWSVTKSSSAGDIECEPGDYDPETGKIYGQNCYTITKGSRGRFLRQYWTGYFKYYEKDFKENAYCFVYQLQERIGDKSVATKYQDKHPWTCWILKKNLVNGKVNAIWGPMTGPYSLPSNNKIVKLPFKVKEFK